MPLLNYTTEVPAAKTAGEIQEMLRKHGASAVIIEYDNGKTTGLSFEIPFNGKSLSYRLPVKPEPVRKILAKRYTRTVWDTNVIRQREQRDAEQAERTAWRIVKDWVEAQLALIDVQMVKFEEVFLPYMLANNGKTVFQIMEGGQFLLTDPRTPA